MTKEHGMADGANVERKRHWHKPTMNRIEAGDAELGTRIVTQDGEFTTS